MPGSLLRHILLRESYSDADDEPWFAMVFPLQKLIKFVCQKVQVSGYSEVYFPDYLSIFNTAKNAVWGISTLPTCFMRFLPSFCFSSNLRLRVMSPP